MDLMPPASRNDDALRFLLTRRSRPPKTLTGPAPGRAELREMLTAAVRVPDHGKLEPWRLIVLEPPALARLAAEAGAYAQAQGMEPAVVQKGVGQFAQSPLCVVVVFSPRPTDKVPLVEQELSAGCVCLSLVNAALAMGWGAGWLTGWVAHHKGFAGPAFGLREGEWVAGLVHIGTETAPPPERPRPDIDALTTWVAE